MNSKTLLLQIVQRLLPIYEASEARSIGFLLLEALFGLSKQAVVLEKQVIAFEEEKLEAALQRLLLHEPIQYVTGQAFFYGQVWKVGRGVLIPRPETEELVHLILRVHQSGAGLRVLDLGTGSGCIAITLARHLPQSQVFGIDISPAALAYAQANAAEQGASVQWLCADMLSDGSQTLVPAPVDIVVSNPPYIREQERSLMQPNVLDYEPSSALFVPDNEALLYYKALCEWTLALQGRYLYAEINEGLGYEVKQLLGSYGFSQIEILQDLSGRDRMVKAIASAP